jgi:galactose mutarotase-like enzyme
VSFQLKTAGGWIDQVLSLADLKAYQQQQAHIGQTAGRVAGRINQGRFQLD